MPVLVTGGGGFAGLHLLRALLAAGVTEIVATVLEDPSFGGSPPEGLEEVEWLTMDVTSTESVREVVRRTRPERVFHLAGQASVGESFGAPLVTWEVNATGTLRLLEALREEAPGARRFVLTSSAEVYGAVPAEEQPIDEGRGYAPVTPYGSSKAAAEVAALQTGGMAGIEVVIARSFNHIGPGQDERFVLPSMARQLEAMRRGRAEPVLRVGDLEVDRDFLDVRDVVYGYRVLMERGAGGEAYNVCSGAAHSLLDVVRRMIELSGTGATLEVDPERVRPVDIPRLVGDPGRLRALGWSPERSLDETLRDLLAQAEGEA
jgi:GDP-4-dehydro-6-deoxy-D-mannose reductase